QKRRHAHRRLAAVAQTVEADPFRIDRGERREPVEDDLVLGEDEREERGLDGVGLAVQIAVAVLAAVRVVRSEADEAALGEAGWAGETGPGNVRAPRRVRSAGTRAPAPAGLRASGRPKTCRSETADPA